MVISPLLYQNVVLVLHGFLQDSAPTSLPNMKQHHHRNRTSLPNRIFECSGAYFIAGYTSSILQMKIESLSRERVVAIDEVRNVAHIPEHIPISTHVASWSHYRTNLDPTNEGTSLPGICFWSSNLALQPVQCPVSSTFVSKAFKSDAVASMCSCVASAR